MQNSRRSLTSRSSPPSTVRMSRILGEVEVRYVRWVSELKSGSGEVVSRAAKTDGQMKARQKDCVTGPHTSPVVQLRRYNYCSSVLYWK